jgi:hypothetical protein
MIAEQWSSIALSTALEHCNGASHATATLMPACRMRSPSMARADTPAAGGNIPGVVSACKSSELCLFFLGTSMIKTSGATVEGEQYDRRSLGLPGAQASLVRAAASQTSAMIVVVLIHGGPLDVSWMHASPRVGAILSSIFPGQKVSIGPAWAHAASVGCKKASRRRRPTSAAAADDAALICPVHSSTSYWTAEARFDVELDTALLGRYLQGAEAIADILLGNRSPSGRLPVTWYKETYLRQVHLSYIRGGCDTA